MDWRSCVSFTVRFLRYKIVKKLRTMQPPRMFKNLANQLPLKLSKAILRSGANYLLKLARGIPRWKWVGEAQRSGFRLPQSSFPLRLHGYSANQPTEVPDRFAHLLFSRFLQPPPNCSQQLPLSFCSARFPFNNPRAFISKLYVRQTLTSYLSLFVVSRNCCNKKCVNSRQDLSWSQLIIMYLVAIISSYDHHRHHHASDSCFHIKVCCTAPATVVAFKRHSAS